jgi:ribosome-binding factor A
MLTASAAEHFAARFLSEVIKMSARRSLRKRLDRMFAEPGPERMGLPEIPSASPAPQRIDRKTLQLCRQVERTLSYVLSDCGDDVLADLFVESVEPAPDASRLMVTVMAADQSREPVEVLTHLQRAAGYVRSEIASSIHRKRVPELAYRCVTTPSATVSEGPSPQAP